MVAQRVLIYVLRHDLRLADNPVFHAVASQKQITHLVPIFIFNPIQYETSGLLKPVYDGKSPFPEARSRLGNFWRCGPHRAKFLAESLFDLKKDLQILGSDLFIRVGRADDIIKDIIHALNSNGSQVQGIWMTRDSALEEMEEERAIEKCLPQDVAIRMFDDESTFIHRKDVSSTVSELPDVFTSFRKSVEPLRSAARNPLETKTSIPPIPYGIPAQREPFIIPEDVESLIRALSKPLLEKPDVALPQFPLGTRSAHPFEGGSTIALRRIDSILSSGAASSYKDTRNGLLGTEFSTKLSAYLAHGCISARQVHSALVRWEDRYNDGRENKGTAAIRFELLWRDYMRFCLEKYGTDFFRLYGFGSGRRSDSTRDEWKFPLSRDSNTEAVFKRWLSGRTSTGLIDASQRELLLTGYTSNRARQNVASYLVKHLHIDWRLGAEWYESMLVDYDCASNWGNWAYVAGVGNDPRQGGEGRKFNPVKQAADYDPHGEYIKAWVEEARGVRNIDCVRQLWMLPESERKKRH